MRNQIENVIFYDINSTATIKRDFKESYLFRFLVFFVKEDCNRIIFLH